VQEERPTQAVSLEVNLEGKAMKIGFRPNPLKGLLPRLGALSRLEVKRPLVILPPTSDLE